MSTASTLLVAGLVWLGTGRGYGGEASKVQGSTPTPNARGAEPGLRESVAGRSVVFLIAEDEYKTSETLPEFARRELEPRGVRVTTLAERPGDHGNFPGLGEALESADLLLISVRRRALPAAQLEAIRQHLDRGKPLVGIRTASHAFAPRGEERERWVVKGGRVEWPQFDPEVLGGNYQGHHGVGPTARIEAAPGAAELRVLGDLNSTPFHSSGSLYRVSPLSASARPLLVGSIPGQAPEPVAWIHRYGPRNARIFYTSLGHPDDFGQPRFRGWLADAIGWALGLPRPGAAAEPPAAQPR